jgi:hypothetical protein
MVARHSGAGRTASAVVSRGNARGWVSLGAALAVVLTTSRAGAQTDAVPSDQVGVWVPAKADCNSSLRLELAPKKSTLVNGTDRVTHGNVGLTYSHFGNSYQGISFVMMPDWDKTQPYVVTFNASEKKGRTQVSFNDAALKKRFPLENVPLKKCGVPSKPAGH